MIWILSFDGKPSPDNPRTPTLVPRSGVLTITFKGKSSPVHMYGVLTRYTYLPTLPAFSQFTYTSRSSLLQKYYNAYGKII